MDNTKVKINLKTGEIEFEGSEKFVQGQMDNLDVILDILSSGQVGEEQEIEAYSEANNASDVNDDDEDNSNPAPSSDLSVPDSFGEWMHKFKDGINDIEKALVTAYYVQKEAPKNDFKTLEVNKSLRDHGIKLSNPSRALKSLEGKKYLFQTRKEGPKIRFMRVSQDGLAHLKTLLR